MIENLPKKIDVKSLQHFDSGSHEAIDDDLLQPCYCPVSAISKFLLGRKDVLHGSKGSGKTAVFQLLLDKFIRFNNPKKLDQILIPISEDLEYMVVKQRTEKYIQSALPDQDLRFRFLWESYILYRVALSLWRKDFLSSELRDSLEEFVELFSKESETPSVMEFLKNAKVKVSFSFGTEKTFFAKPEFSIEPGMSDRENVDTEEHCINLDVIKQALNQALIEKQSVLYVLIDNIDKFAEREAYKVQKEMTDGLMQAIESYKGISQINPKAFIRTEQYYKTDHARLSGKDKSGPRATELVWSDADIRRLLANRIKYNLDTMFESDRELQFWYNEDELHGRRRFLDIRGIRHFTECVIGLFRKNRSGYDERIVSLSDQFAKDLITLFFPREVDHFKEDGSPDGQPIFEWISKHFKLANEQSVPRTIIVFLEHAIRCAIRYYEENDDLEFVYKNGFNEYPLITKGAVSRAYGQTQLHVVDGVCTSTTHKPWQKKLEAVFPRVGAPPILRESEIKSIAEIKSESELREFCAYARHLGAIARSKRPGTAFDPEYVVPILLQRNWVEERLVHDPLNGA